MIAIAEYQPVFEDWLWHVALPLVADARLPVAAVVLPLGLEQP